MRLAGQDVAQIFAGYGLAWLASRIPEALPGLTLRQGPPGHGLVLAEGGDLPLPPLALRPRHPGGLGRPGLDVQVGGREIGGLDWWRRGCWATAATLRWPPVDGVRPWKPWAGQLDLVGGGAARLSAAVAEMAGMSIRDALAARGDAGHDWSGLDGAGSAARDLGFSPHLHGMRVLGRPALTLLAMIGLQAVPLVRAGTRQDAHIVYPVWWPEREGDPLTLLAEWPQIVGISRAGGDAEGAEPPLWAAPLVYLSDYLYRVSGGGRPVHPVDVYGEPIGEAETARPAGGELEAPTPEQAAAERDMPPSRRRGRRPKVMRVPPA